LVEIDCRVGAAGVPIDFSQRDVASGSQRGVKWLSAQDAVCTGYGLVIPAGELKQFGD
jgi:hypothetical protein